jgi:hypothetical protein
MKQLVESSAEIERTVNFIPLWNEIDIKSLLKAHGNAFSQLTGLDGCTSLIFNRLRSLPMPNDARKNMHFFVQMPQVAH